MVLCMDPLAECGYVLIGSVKDLSRKLGCPVSEKQGYSLPITVLIRKPKMHKVARLLLAGVGNLQEPV